MIETILSLAVKYMTAMGLWGIGLGMAVESACIPLPSEIILPLGGYLVYLGKVSFWGAVLAGTIGGTGGSILAYFIGLKGGRPLLKKYGKYIFFSEKEFAVADRWFSKHGEATVFWTRLMPVVRTFISLPAGIARMNFPKFVIFTFAGSLPWSIFLVYVGFKMGEKWNTLKPYFHKADIVVIVAVVVLIIYWIYKKRKDKVG